MRPLSFAQRWLLALIILAAFALPAWYSTQIPLGEGPDEPGHAEMAFFIARTGRLPVVTVGEAVGEGHQPPLAYWLYQPAARLVPVGEREVILGANPRWIWAGGDEPAAFGVRTRDSWPYRGDVAAWHAMRLISALIIAGLAAATFWAGRRLDLDPAEALVGAGLVAVWPQILFHGALVSNDPLLWLLGALLLGLLARPSPHVRWVAATGLVLMAALLTKQSAVLFIPLVALVLWRERRELALWPAALSIAGIVTVGAGWWYLRNLRLYGDILGFSTYTETFGSRTFDAASLTAWSDGLGQLGASLVARFGWMSVAGPGWLLALAAMIALAGAVGWARKREAWSSWTLPAALIALALVWTVAFAVVSGAVAWQGRFVLPAAAALALTLAAGLRRLAPWLGPTAIVAMGTATLLLPGLVFERVYTPQVVAAQPEAPLVARWAPDDGPPFLLRGLELPTRAERGATLAIETLWEAEGPQPRDWSQFWHLVPVGSDEIAADVDRQPRAGSFAATRWTPGDWWRDTTPFTIPADLAPGVYELRLGWFDEVGTQQRAAVRALDNTLLGDYVVLGRIAIE